MGRPAKREKPAFSKNIVLRRNALGWSAERLAEEAELPYPTIRDIEAGISGGRPATREKIAETLGCSVADLYVDGSEAGPVTRPAPSQLDTLIKDFASAPHSAVSQVLQELAATEPEIRAAVLAVLYSDPSISAPYARKKAQGSKSAGK